MFCRPDPTGDGESFRCLKKLCYVAFQICSFFVWISVVVDIWRFACDKVSSAAMVNMSLRPSQSAPGSRGRLIRNVLSKAFRGILQLRSIPGGPGRKYAESPGYGSQMLPPYGRCRHRRSFPTLAKFQLVWPPTCQISFPNSQN